MKEENALELLEEAIALAKLELHTLEENKEDSLSLADGYASKRYAIVTHAWEIQKKDNSYPLFKEKIQELYELQKKLLLVAEAIQNGIAQSIKETQYSQKALNTYKYTVQQEKVNIVKNSIG